MGPQSATPIHSGLLPAFRWRMGGKPSKIRPLFLRFPARLRRHKLSRKLCKAFCPVPLLGNSAINCCNILGLKTSEYILDESDCEDDDTESDTTESDSEDESEDECEDDDDDDDDCEEDDDDDDECEEEDDEDSDDDDECECED
ncbi:hypothetical protein HPP92_027909 [Vanilla planifolia]|uniref:Uncharacterized protein n=1 Tax=Vanilla planifolia TaxID=51239 RepID=A0A835P9D5_VANPL|nr:hypothetical protein HPP92_027909 [Vanilla planifolia]KAG0488508.1 hypothetical protein HPP92_007319 [Vanilla planifolia]